MDDQWVDAAPTAPADDGWVDAPAAPLAQLQPKSWTDSLLDLPNQVIQHSQNLLSQAGDTEALHNFASGMGAQLKAGLHGLDAFLTSEHPLDSGMSEATQAIDKSLKDSEKDIYQPETEAGKAALETIGLPTKLGAAAGEKTLDITGSPFLATAADLLTQNAPFMLAGGLHGGAEVAVKGDVGLDALKAAESPAEAAPEAAAPQPTEVPGAGDQGTITPDVAPAPKPHYTAEQVARGEHLQPPDEAAEPTGNPVTDRFNAKLQDYDQAKQDYANLPDTQGGTVINTDIARELSDDYRQDRTLSADVHEPASAFTKQLYADKLSEPTPEGKEPTVLFTAGGTGAGKSSGLKVADIGSPEIVYDTNMNKMSSATDKVQQALDAGRDVHIVYTYRDPVEAFRNGALPRAMRMEGELGSGRTVPLDEHVKTHVGASDVVRQIADKYKDDPRVSITAIDNSRGAGNARLSSLEELPKVEQNGLKGRLQQQLEEAHANGEISDSIRSGFEGRKPGLAEKVSEQPEPGNVLAKNAGTPAERPPEQVGEAPVSAPGDVNLGSRTSDRPAVAGREPGSASASGGLEEKVLARGNELPEVSARNAAIDAQRERLGLEPLPTAERKAWETSRDEAAKIVKDDPDAAQKIIADQKATDRPLTDAEQVVLAEHASGIEKKWSAADEAVNAAKKSGDGIAEMRAEGDRQYYEAKAHEAHEVLNKGGGTAVARSLAIRNAILTDRYTIGRNMERAEASYGSLTDRLRNEARRHSQEINKAKQELEDLQHKQEMARQNQPKQAPQKRTRMTDEEREHAKVQKQVADKLKAIKELQERVERRLSACPL